jgi:RimJ/RimL family protein N-acetyltransferase
LLEGKTLDLRLEERDDVDFEVECCNNIDFWGEYDPIVEQRSKSERMKQFDNPSNLAILAERKRFIIQKKDGTKIGIINHRLNQPYRTMEIVCFLVPSERRKGYGAEAFQLMVNYLFLSSSIVRIQAITNVENKPARRVLEKVGFKIEGTIRKLLLVRGIWTDYYLLSILREEWKEPKILTRVT